MIKPTLTLVAALIGVSLHSLADEAKTISLPVHAGGRVLVEQHLEQTTYTYSWPGVYFTAAFSGPTLDVHFNDDQNIFALIIDDKDPIQISKPGKQVYSLKNLGKGEHRVRLEKLTETQSSTGKFEGFYIPATQKPGKITPPKHQIEFIGDSYTVGYGNTSTTRDCTTEDVYKTTNTQVAFGPLLAKHLDADYQINASSGFGVVRNYNGTSPDKSLLKLYPYTLNDAGQVYQNSDWHPQLIVAGLGTNDFSTPLNPQEKWKTREELRQDYVATYVDFIGKLHKREPNAFLLLMASDAFNGEIAQQAEKVVAQAKAAGNNRIALRVFKNLDQGGCHWHPSAKDDRLLKQDILDFISNQPDLGLVK